MEFEFSPEAQGLTGEVGGGVEESASEGGGEPGEEANVEVLELPRGFDAELTLYCSREAERLGLLELAASVEVWWNGRLRTTAGLAEYLEARIELNPLLMKFQPTEPKHTLCHELAHLVAHVRWGGKRRISAHGPEWRRACADLGIPGEKANHNLPLAPRRRVARRWRYHCGYCGQTHDRVRPYRGRVACWECCRQYSGGKYHDKFLLEGIRIAMER
ncbi:MAG: SprT-like domain-containing protein [Verrucomicrobiota bacterium]